MIKLSESERIAQLEEVIRKEEMPMDFDVIRQLLDQRRHEKIVRGRNIEKCFMASTLYDVRELVQMGKFVPEFFHDIFSEGYKEQKEVEIFYKKVDFFCNTILRVGTTMGVEQLKTVRFPRELGGGMISGFYSTYCIEDSARFANELAANNERVIYFQERAIATGRYEIKIVNGRKSLQALRTDDKFYEKSGIFLQAVQREKGKLTTKRMRQMYFPKSLGGSSFNSFYVKFACISVEEKNQNILSFREELKKTGYYKEIMVNGKYQFEVA